MSPKVKKILRKMFTRSQLVRFLIAVIALLIALIMSLTGKDLGSAVEWVILGLGLGALLAWAVGYPDDPGSGSPTWRRVRFFNRSKRKSLGVKLKKTDVPNSPTNEGQDGPPTPPKDVDPDGAAILDRPADRPFDDGVQGVRINFQIDAGPAVDVTAALALSPPTVPPDPLSSSFLEEVWAFLDDGDALGTYELAVLLMHATDTQEPLVSHGQTFDIPPQGP